MLEGDSSAHGNGVGSAFERIVGLVTVYKGVVQVNRLLEAWSLPRLFAFVVVLGVLYALLVDLVYPVVSFP